MSGVKRMLRNPTCLRLETLSVALRDHRRRRTISAGIAATHFISATVNNPSCPHHVGSHRALLFRCFVADFLSAFRVLRGNKRNRSFHHGEHRVYGGISLRFSQNPIKIVS